MGKIFQDKVVLITGSARGIGAACARLAHARGATVILHGRTQSDHLENLSKELGNALTIACDVGDKDAVKQSLREVIEKLGKIDVLINSAGMSVPQSFMESDDDNWNLHFQTHVMGTVHFCQSIIPIMQKNMYGRIVNVASIRGHTEAASNRIMAYSAAKAAIVNLTASLAKEYGPTISVNAVSPGFTMTNIKASWNEIVYKQLETALSGRAAKPEEIAEAILFLASDAASFVTGQTLVVDGGYTMAGK